MKKTILFVISLIVSVITVNAQYNSYIFPAGDQSVGPNIDNELREIRINGFPNVRYKADDYLQYSPGLAMLIAKSCGYKSRDNWAGMVTATAFAGAIEASLVNGIKYSVKRMRPDESRRNSFPSGHTATAFMTATMLHIQYGWRSPIWSIGGYTMAAAVGISRMVNNRHWLTDTVFGALIGVGSAHLATLITDKIYRNRQINETYEPICWEYNKDRKTWDFDVVYLSRLILNNHEEIKNGSAPDRGSIIALNGSFPISTHWGLNARIGAGSLETNNIYNGIVGGYYRLSFLKRLSLDAHTLIGYADIACRPNDNRPFTQNINCFNAVAGINLGIIIADHFKIKAWAEYENVTTIIYRPVNAINLGFSYGFYW